MRALFGAQDWVKADDVQPNVLGGVDDFPTAWVSLTRCYSQRLLWAKHTFM